MTKTLAKYNELYSITAVIVGKKKKEIRTYKSEVVIPSYIDMHISLLSWYKIHFHSAIVSVDHSIKCVSLVSINPVFLGNDQNTQEYNELYSITAVIMGIKKKEIRTYKSEVVIQSCIDMHISLLSWYKDSKNDCYSQYAVTWHSTFNSSKKYSWMDIHTHTRTTFLFTHWIPFPVTQRSTFNTHTQTSCLLIEYPSQCAYISTAHFPFIINAWTFGVCRLMLSYQA